MANYALFIEDCRMQKVSGHRLYARQEVYVKRMHFCVAEGFSGISHHNYVDKVDNDGNTSFNRKSLIIPDA